MLQHCWEKKTSYKEGSFKLQKLWQSSNAKHVFKISITLGSKTYCTFINSHTNLVI